MLNKIKSIVSKFLPSRITEGRIRRVVELATFIFGIVSLVVSFLKILVWSGTFQDNITGIVIGLLAINVAYRGLCEDLPKFGALQSKRRFWE